MQREAEAVKNKESALNSMYMHLALAYIGTLYLDPTKSEELKYLKTLPEEFPRSRGA